MNEFPPPRSDGADAARAERLAELQRRRAGTSAPAGATTRPPRPTPTDPGLRAAERLAALADRREPRGSTAAATTTEPTRSASRRRHPAKGARAAALGLSLASTGGLAAFFALTGPTAGAQVEAAQIVTPMPATSPTTSSATSSMVTSTAASVDATSAPVRTGPSTTTVETAPAATATVVNGAVFHNKWGDVQVQATFAPDGSIVDVAALRTPTRDGKSVRINDRAVPRLNAEALTIQNANVDTVSGATYTSTDYRRSLQSAIDAALAAGIPAASA